MKQQQKKEEQERKEEKKKRRKNKIPNNRFNLANPLARSLQEQQCKLRAKPYGHGFEG